MPMSGPGFRTPARSSSPGSDGDSARPAPMYGGSASPVDSNGESGFARLVYPELGSTLPGQPSPSSPATSPAASPAALSVSENSFGEASRRVFPDDEAAASHHLAGVFPGFLSIANPASASQESAWGAEDGASHSANASHNANAGPMHPEEATSGDTGLSAEWQDGWLAGLQQGRQEGREEGREEGRVLAASADRDAMHESLEQIRQQVLAALNDFAAERERFFHELEQEAVRLALAIAARILRREAQMDPLLLTGAVRVALGQLGESTTVRLIVPETDRVLWEESLRLTPGLRQRPEVIGDPRMELGECRIETGMGENGFGGADLSLHEQLREIERGFFDRLPQRQTSASQPTAAQTSSALSSMDAAPASSTPIPPESLTSDDAAGALR